MKNISNLAFISIVSCIIELALVKYGQFAFGGIFFIFGIFGGLAWLMGHKNLGRGLLIGLLLFAVVLLAFGYLFMNGWMSPQEYYKLHR